MQAIRFGDLFRSAHRQTAQTHMSELSRKGERPRMTSITVSPEGERVWFVATGLDRLHIEGLQAFDGEINDAYQALGRQIAREEAAARRAGEDSSNLSRSGLFVKYRPLVELYLQTHERLRLFADEALKHLRKATDLDAG